VTFECLVCHPVEGTIVDCFIKTITKAGIHGEVIDEDKNIPVVVFIARDHHMNNTDFENVKTGEKIRVRIIGIRYELNDPNICSIGHIFTEKKE
jgi:DNA-directed RNA polymerase subunit E'/Rpb7